MAIFYVDLSNGSNLNTGDSPSSPLKDFTNLNAGGAWDGNEVRIKRGSTGVVSTSSNRANVNAPLGCLITAYGDAAAPLPVISGGNIGFNPLWLRNGSNITVEKVHVTRAAGSGLVVSPIAGSSLSTIKIRDVLVTENTQNNTFWGTDGIQIGGFATVDAGNVTDVLLERVVARENGGHGFKARGRAKGVVVKDSVALRNGKRTPAHGLGTAGQFAELNNTSTGAKDIRTGWTNVSGNIWEHALSEPGSVTSITSWFGVWIIGAGPVYYKLPYSATPSTPGPGECGIGAANTVRINIGAQNPNTLVSLFGVFARPEDVKFFRCVASETFDTNPTGTPIEGQGIYFDNGSYNCYSYECLSYDNQGHGLYLNDPTECGHYRPIAFNNGKAVAGISRGDGSTIMGGILAARPGTRGVECSTGNQRAKVLRSQIIGATVGIWTNDSGTNQVSEENNQFIGCGSRLMNVSNPGLLSVDMLGSSLGPSQNLLMERLKLMAASGELFI